MLSQDVGRPQQQPKPTVAQTSAVTSAPTTTDPTKFVTPSEDVGKK